MSSSTPAELQARYTALSSRIAALDKDIAFEMDNERRTIARERRDALAAEREQVAADMHLIGVIPQPIAQVEHRVSMLEREISKLWALVKPGPRQVLARVIFYGLIFGLWSMWMIKEVRDWLLSNPLQAILISLAVVVAALIIRWLPDEVHHDER